MGHQIVRALQMGLRFAIPLLFVVTLGWSTYDYFHPWALADSLVPQRAGQARLLVGASFSSNASYSTPENVSERTADYIYYPEVLRSRERYALSQRSDVEPVVYRSSFSPLSYLIGLVVAAALCVAAWCIPMTRRRSTPSPNISLQRDREG
jgi:hypothetical protein